MRRLCVVGISGFCLLTAAAVVSADYPKPVKKELYADDGRGKKAPALDVERWLTSEPKLEGKVVLVDLWATWCGPCRAAIPELNKIQKHFQDDLVVVGLSSERAETITEFMKTNKMEYALAVDTKKRMGKALNVRGIPHVLIISTDGVVRWQGFPMSEEEPLTDKIIKQIIDSDPGVAARRKSTK